MEVNEDDVVLCTVKKIEGTTVFLDIEGDGPGSMVMSEVAAGRIRNLREYVIPNKKIVCKVLRIVKGTPQLSLRRVTSKEREIVMDHYKKERSLTSMLKTITKSPEKILEKIKAKYDIVDFLEEARESPKILENFMTKSESLSLAKILAEKKEKEKTVRKIISIISHSPSGLKVIKEILVLPDVKISYLGSSNFSISASGKDFKEANQKIDLALLEIEKRSKKHSAILEIKESKK